MTNLSRPVEFEPGTLVMYYDHVYIVDHNSGMALCWVKRNGGDPIAMNEASLRTLTFREFASFIHPITGGWMVGKTRGYMAALIHLFSFFLLGASVSQDGGWWSAFALIPVVGFWIGTYKNWNKSWV